MCRHTFRPLNRACSTARATTTDASAVRCARASRSPGSENVPAVALLSDLGVPTLVRFLRHAGFSTFDKTASHYGLGLTLGNAEVRLDELVGAYAAFARGGAWIRPHAIDVGIVDRRVDAARHRSQRDVRAVVVRAHGVLDHRRAVRSGSARLRVRTRRQP